MRDLQAFNNDDFGQIRAVEIDGEPWFVGTDVATALGYGNAPAAIKRHVDPEDRKDGITFRDTVGRVNYYTIINESGLYSLILSSKLPGAKRFKKWVTSDVLPSIRKHGVFATEDFAKMVLEDPQFFITTLQTLQEVKQKNQALKEIVGAQDRQIEEMQPKARYCDLVLACKDAVSISKIAKDYGWSAIRMNTTLRELGIQFKQGDQWLLYQKYADKGYATSKTQTFIDGKSVPHSRLHTYWTQKGRLFIYDVLKEKEILPLIEQNLKAHTRTASGDES